MAGTILTLAGCANTAAIKNAAMSTPGFLDRSDTTEIQRPTLPISHYIKWSPGDRLREGVEIDYINGMSQRDYLFQEPNKELFRPMLEGALAKTGLRSHTAAGARYALQIEFSELSNAHFGRNLAGKTRANYRLG